MWWQFMKAASKNAGISSPQPPHIVRSQSLWAGGIWIVPMLCPSSAYLFGSSPFPRWAFWQALAKPDEYSCSFLKSGSVRHVWDCRLPIFCAPCSEIHWSLCPSKRCCSYAPRVSLWEQIKAYSLKTLLSYSALFGKMGGCASCTFICVSALLGSP